MTVLPRGSRQPVEGADRRPGRPRAVQDYQCYDDFYDGFSHCVLIHPHLFSVYDYDIRRGWSGRFFYRFITATRYQGVDIVSQRDTSTHTKLIIMIIIMTMLMLMSFFPYHSATDTPFGIRIGYPTRRPNTVWCSNRPDKLYCTEAPCTVTRPFYANR
jgi:hypothetical protein